MGYGGRMLGALSSDNNFTYIGTDPNTETYKNLKYLGEMIEQVKKDANYKLFNLCSEQLQLSKETVDFAFSCPPFFNKETYTNEETQSIQKFPLYNEWLEGYVRKTIQNCYHALKKDGVFAFDILDYTWSGKRFGLVEDWCRIAKEEGFYFKDKIAIKSRFRKKDEESGEFIYLFMKAENNKLPNYTEADLLTEAQDLLAERQRRAYRRAHLTIVEYDAFGKIRNTYNKYEDVGVNKKIIDSKAIYNDNTYYRVYRGEDIIKDCLDDIKQPICCIDNKYFTKQTDLARYLGISRQAVQQSYKRKTKEIMNKPIKWFYKDTA